MPEPGGGGTRPHWTRTALRALVTFEQVISVLLLLMIVSLIFAQVVARYVFNAPLFWSDELARYTYVWLSFIAAVFVAAERGHIQIDVIDRLLGPRGRLVVEIVAGLIVIGTCLFVIYGSWPWLMTNIRPRSPALRLPMVWLYGVVWLAFALIALHTLINLVRLLTGTEEPEATPNYE
jgi:TRAP-type C4-dicarboxylate transport system permease small subunit